MVPTLMMGKLMFGNRSMGSRSSATSPRMATPSEAMRMAIALRSASRVIHMAFGARALARSAHERRAAHEHSGLGVVNARPRLVDVQPPGEALFEDHVQ